MIEIGKILKPEYFLAVPENSIFEIYYLYLSIFVLVAVVILRIVLKKKKRAEVFKSFDKNWFWGYFTIGLLGLFFWLARSQGLSTFGTRLASYIWVISIFVYAVYLLLYFKFKTSKKIPKFYEKQRKEKYLKK